MLVAWALAVAAPAHALVGFRGILPVGQGQSINAADLAQYELTGTPPPTFVNQLAPFENLLYDAPQLTLDKLLADFPDTSLGTSPAPTTVEMPKAGVTVTRDKNNVPHVVGATRADTLFGAGYVQAEDRLFEMDVLRHLGRADMTEFVGPSYMSLDRAIWMQSDYTDDELTAQVNALAMRYGAAGAAAIQDEKDYIAGINAYIAAARNDPTKLPGEYAALGKQPADWTLADSVAIAAEINQGFDLGGGAEAQDAQLLGDLQAKLGRRAGAKAYADIRRREDPTAPTTTSKRFAFDNPGRFDPRSAAPPDPGTYHARDPFLGAASQSRAPQAALATSRLARQGGESYAYLVAADKSASGHPVADMGPQLDFYSPELLSEEELTGPGIGVRGPVLPGALPVPIVGHTANFAWSVTIGVGDHIDTYAEKLCTTDGSKPTLASDHYVYKGKCVPFVVRDRVEHSAPNASDSSAPATYTLRTVRSVHGPIQGYATVHGRPVAYARADATYHHLAETGLFYGEMLDNTKTPQDFIRYASQVPFSLNWFYIDAKHIAWTLSGSYPRRARGVGPDLPAWGTGKWDWKGFDPSAYTERDIPAGRLPHVLDPKQGFIANWNNKPAPGWRAADDDLYYGSVHRVQMVRSRIQRALRKGPLDPVGLAALVEDADTVDLRGERDLPAALKIIGKAPDAATQKLVDALHAWVAAGAHRRDLDKDNVYESSGAVALMDAWWPRLVPAIFRPVMGGSAFDQSLKLLHLDDYPAIDAEAYYDGWYGQVYSDLRDALGYRGKGRLSRVYCGSGSRARCRKVLISTLQAAAADVAKAQGSDDISTWKVPATCDIPSSGPPPCDEIVFTATGAVSTPPIPWQNRPTYQQVVELGG
jgi:acyl-homoserine lactone acylase PvdQ